MSQFNVALPDIGPHNMHEYVDSYINPTLMTLLGNSSVGDVWPRCNTNVENLAQNGLTLTTDTVGKVTGFSLPSGQTGNFSFISIAIPWTPALAARLAGRTVRLSANVTATAGWQAAHPLQADVSVIRSGSETSPGVAAFGTQIGTSIWLQSDFAVAGDETRVMMTVQLSGSVSSGSSMTAAISGVSWRVIDTLNAAAPAGETAVEMARAIRHDGVGNIYRDLRSEWILNTGMVPIYGPQVVWPGVVIGVQWPTGVSSGTDHLISYIYKCSSYESDILQGRYVRFYASFDTTNNLARNLLPVISVYTVAAPTGANPADMLALRNEQIGTRRILEIGATFPSGSPITQIALGIVWVNPDYSATALESMVLTDLTYDIVETTSALLNDAEENRRAREKRDKRSVMRAAGDTSSSLAFWSYRHRLMVPVAPADPSYQPFTSYATVAAALTAANALTEVGPVDRVEIVCQNGFYDDGIEYKPTQPYIDFRGQSKYQTRISLHQAANSSLTNIQNNSTLNLLNNHRLTNLYVTVQNGRYGVHADSQVFNTNTGGLQEFLDCKFEHLGNDDARAYQTSISADPNAVWTNCYGLAVGTSDGENKVFKNCDFIGYNIAGCAGHSNYPFVSPSSLYFENCVFDSQDDTQRSFFWENLGQLNSDVIVQVGCQFRQFIGLEFSPWLNDAAAAQIANKANMTWTGHGNSPVPFVVADDGSRALRIDSATTGTSSSVAVSGTAATALFGGSNLQTLAVGAAGLAGAVYGYWDVAEHLVGPSVDEAITSMGYRLGDCSTVSKTLTVVVNGGSPINIVFNTNLTAATNASILTTINTALGASATASLFNVNDLFRPNFMDEEIRIKNTDTTTILRKTAVKFDTTTTTGKVMTSTDAANLFAGVALEDIRPGQIGRVKCRGALRVANDMLRSDAGTFVIGDSFGVGSTAGRFVHSPTIPLMLAVNASDVKLGTGNLAR